MIMRHIGVGQIFIVLSLSLNSAQSFADTMAPGHIDFGSIPLQKEERALAALRNPTQIIELPKSEVQKNEMERIWSGNTPLVSAQVKDLILAWQRETEGGEQPRKFYLHFEFKEDTINVRSSRTGLLGPEVGLILGAHQKKIVPLTAAGDPEERMVIITTRIEDDQAVMLCGRRYEDALKVPPELRGNSTATRILIDNLFRVVDVKGDVSGTAQGRIIAGRGAGLASGALLTSPGVPRSVEYKDSTLSKNAEIKLEYRAKSETDSADAVADPSARSDDPLSERAVGISAVLDLKNSAGYRRVVTKQDVVRVKKITVEASDQILIGEGLGQGAGSCYLIYRELNSSIEYKKEEPPI